MPLYTVQHSVPLTDGQYDEIVQIITDAHCNRFKVPRLFVHVSFEDISTRVGYIGGKRVHANIIRAAIRPGVPGSGDRSDEMVGSLLVEIEQGWARVVGAELSTIAAEASIQAVVEKGYVLPKAGADGEWLRKNLESFKERAAQGDADFVELIKHL